REGCQHPSKRARQVSGGRLAPGKKSMATNRHATNTLMQTQTESERIRRVYAGYRERGLSQGKWSEENPGNRAIVRERQTIAASMLAEARSLTLENQEVLEVGCGSGKVLRNLVEIGAAGARCHGVDLLP